MALVPSVCSHFFFERSSRHQDTTCASVTSEVRASLTTIMTHTQPWTMMASLENKVDEQVSKVPQQNGGNCRNEELQLEDFRDNNNESIEVEMVVPPDGGWGWMIVAASFMCNLFVDGIIFSFGVFLNDISEAFAVSKARVALVGSLQSGFYLMAGPFVSALANRYGFRLVAILGSVISCSAFVLSYFSTSIEFLYISYGVLGGIGAGLIYVPAVITTGFYFERWRALATGIAVCGSGIGAFMLAPISDILVKQFGWRGALLFQAGMLLNCAIFGAMFRPLKSTRIKVKSSPENAGLEVKSSLMARGVSTASLHCMQPGRSGFFGTNNNTDYPTAAELLGSNPNIVNASKSLHSLHKIHAELRTLERKLSSSEKRLSVPIYPELDVNMDEKMVEEENNLLGGDVERLNGKVPTIRRHTISGRRLRADSDCSQKSLKMGNRRNPFSKDPQRPFYRDDIFYGGSLNRLPHYKSQQSSVGYHMSVTRLPTATDVAEEESGSCYICPESVRRILTTMLDLSLLKSPSFLILAISGGLTMMGFYTPFMYVPDRAQLAGIEASTAMFLVSVIGIGNTIGRVVCGLASSLPGVNALVVNNIFISAAGLFTIFSGLSLSKGYQFFYAAGFGTSISVFASLRSILVVDLLGLEKLTNAFGLLLLFQGVAAAVGAPLAGIFMDATGSYDASFYLSGSLIFLSAVICYPLKRINVWETKKNGDKCSDDPS